MKTFNNTDLFTGYLKQLLVNFNLPKLKIYTQSYKDYYTKNNEESSEILSSSTIGRIAEEPSRYFPYIRNNEIQEYINGE
jgi:hypothetical protein